MKSGFQGRTAIVTGSGRGIGRAVAITLAEQGVRVVVADIDFRQARQVADEILDCGGRALAVKADVAKARDIDKLLDRATGEFGAVDILVNNAGICPRTAFAEITEAEWDRVLAVNLKSVFLLSQKAIAAMSKRRRGVIINMASGAGKNGGAQVGAHYSASKAAVICLTKTLAHAGAKYGVRANAICPGVVDTEMTTAISAARIRAYRTMIPLGRLGTAQDIANAVVFLASDEASYVTGEIFDVNGGFIMD